MARVVLLLAGSFALATDDPLTSVRLAFKQAYAAAIPAEDSEALRSYALYPYLQAARLRRALKLPDRNSARLDAQVAGFLQAQAGQPVVRDLHSAWLRDLAQRQAWKSFLQYFPVVTTDTELRCWQATALLQSTPASDVLQSLLPELWLKGTSTPTACAAPFAWGRANQIITEQMIEQRARLALQAGNTALARELAAELEPAVAEAIRQWAILIEKPQQAIDAVLANPGIQVASEALQDGWLRLARKDVDAALSRFALLRQQRAPTPQTASPYARSLALVLSWSRRSEALQYFAQVLPADQTDQVHEWHVRAALWAGDWTRVKQVIVAMPEPLRSQARWRYWLVRAQQALNESEAARALYESLNDDNYYAAMAAARQGRRYTPHAQAINADPASAAALEQQVEVQRMRELVAVGLRSDAVSEWNVAATDWSRDVQQAAARLVAGWGWHEQTILVTARLGLYNDYVLLYPRPYDAPVRAAAQLSGLTQDLIYAQMRQESLFQADVVSSANARGLMQLLPATARSTARQFRLKTPTAENLFDPVVNVPLGAAHMKSLLKSFEGQYVLALAAYNAGATAARRWLPEQRMDSDVWIENIPYNETRNYVQRILWHSLVFHWLRVDQPVDNASWLAPVSPLS